jgi:hypothetical protein
VDGNTGSEWMVGKLAGDGGGVFSVGSGQGPLAGSYERGDEPSSSESVTPLHTPLLLYSFTALQSTSR